MDGRLARGDWRVAEQIGSTQMFTRQELDRSWSYCLVPAGRAISTATPSRGFAFEKDACEAARTALAQALRAAI